MADDKKNAAKAERMREALRANLRRRKTQDQDRNRKKPEPPADS